MVLKRVILVLFVLWFSVRVRAENQSIERFFAEFRNLVEEKYVNPNEINLELWLNNVEQTLRAECKDKPCFNSDFERILSAEVRKVNDIHFSVFSLQPEVSEIPDITLGQETRVFRFGFQMLFQVNRLVVQYVQPKTPADRAGLLVGDEIVAVNDVRKPGADLLASIDRAEAQHLETKFKIVRKGISELNIQITPEASKIWQPWYQILDSSTAILYIPNFAERNVTDVLIHKLVNDLMNLGVTKLILDLRVNRGGTSYTVVNSVGAFLPEVKRIYKTKSELTFTYQFKSGSISATSSAKPGEVDSKTFSISPAQYKGFLRILTSSSTVSGPENFAEMLKFDKRARVVGETTAGGAGVTAEVFDLSSGGRIGISTYRQYHADGSIVPTKVIPDVNVSLNIARLSKGEDTQVLAAVQDFGNAP